MKKSEYIRRKIRNSRRRKKNIVVTVSILAAVILVVCLGIGKIYQNVKNEGQEQNVGAGDETSVQAAVDTETVETVANVTEQAPAPRSKAVALTFDDGPSRANDGRILDTLKKYDAHATFFVLGDRARVDGDILQMYLEAGCEIGSHSWNHPRLDKIKWKKVESQINRTFNIVKKLTKGYEIEYLRPPYGAISNKMRKKLKVPMILWSVDTLDWETRNPKKIFKEVKKQVKDGDIILLHDIHETTAEAVEKIVPWLQEQDYDMLTVGELMERKGKKLEGGKAYMDGR